jgi:hypothetical protein
MSGTLVGISQSRWSKRLANGFHERRTMQVKITIHLDKGKFVVNTPGTHVQRQPRVYGSLDKAVERAQELGA